MKVWQTQLTAINHKTGDLEQFISPHYFQGYNYQHAHESLSKSGMDYLQLTGVWFNSVDDAMNHTKFYETFSEPYNLTKGMTFDEFHDWLALGEMDDVIAALYRFREDGRVQQYVEMIEGYLKHKYGWKEDEGEEKGSEEA